MQDPVVIAPIYSKRFHSFHIARVLAVKDHGLLSDAREHLAVFVIIFDEVLYRIQILPQQEGAKAIFACPGISRIDIQDGEKFPDGIGVHHEAVFGRKIAATVSQQRVGLHGRVIKQETALFPGPATIVGRLFQKGKVFVRHFITATHQLNPGIHLQHSRAQTL